MTDVTISHELIRDIICNQMSWEPVDAESFIQLAEEGEPGALRAAIRQHWLWGYRGPELHSAVRHFYPTATLEEYNTAADAVSAEVKGTP